MEKRPPIVGQALLEHLRMLLQKINRAILIAGFKS
jgi:hypothetical protein